MASQTDLSAKTRSAGQVLFVAGALIVTLLLLAQIGHQTAWSDTARNFASQPRLWPGIALAVMATGFGLHILRMRRRRPNRLDWVEARRWLEPVEYALWFMVYVFAVPQAGFLPMSLIFAAALTWRMGYRQRWMLLVALLFACATVLIFKAILGVNIPGGAIYHLLPDGLRSFFLTYL